ncbi:MAG: hypothetical protein NVS3B20_00550 [Polyangiales bacterium]
MSKSLSWTINPNDSGLHVAISGEFTEDSNFNALLEACGSSKVVLDLADVRRINSCGVREWIDFVAALKRAGHLLAIERCSVPVVHQLNMIAGFGGSAEVRSVYCPYRCISCGADKDRLVELPAEKGDVVIEESIACTACGAEMEFDDLSEHYLSFRHDRQPH